MLVILLIVLAKLRMRDEARGNARQPDKIDRFSVTIFLAGVFRWFTFFLSFLKHNNASIPPCFLLHGGSFVLFSKPFAASGSYFHAAIIYK